MQSCHGIAQYPWHDADPVAICPASNTARQDGADFPGAMVLKRSAGTGCGFFLPDQRSSALPLGGLVLRRNR
jgi:hypothetical protein